jgi:beta-glucanase (GH16 family)
MFGKDHLQWPLGKLKKSLFTHTYGYYECRCRLQQKNGWWSAFWMQSPTIGCDIDPAVAGVEIDIMESFRPGNVVKHNVFSGGYGQDMHRNKVGGEIDLAVEEFHRFGLLWDETGYTFYIDGKEDGHIDADVSHRPEFILISTEPQGYRYEDHQPTAKAKAAIGDTFLVDYVRVFDCVK